MSSKCGNLRDDNSSQSISKTNITTCKCELDEVWSEFKNFHAYFLHNFLKQSKYYYELPLLNKENDDNKLASMCKIHHKKIFYCQMNIFLITIMLIPTTANPIMALTP
jgi:hypothetical protein